MSCGTPLALADHPDVLPGDYWGQSARPLASLALIAPLLLLYELGSWLAGGEGLRTAADLWLRGVLSAAGFRQGILLPALIIGLLLAWHHARREPWQLAARTVGRMWGEAAAWGLVLFIIGNLTITALAGEPAAAHPVAVAFTTAHAASAVSYLGAGIYEELLFRLLSVPPSIALLRLAGFNKTASVVTAVVTTSLLFAAAHYQLNVHLFGLHLVWAHGEAFSPHSFLFRFAAGAAFAGLLACRGFGIAAAAHAFYDLLALVA